MARPSAADPAAGARAAFTAPQRAGLLAATALLIALRLPHAWAHGRFLDEEATVFLAFAWHYPWATALFRPFAGYWNLAANGITLLDARLVQGGALPLAAAPYLTMAAGLVGQLVPAILLLTGRARWLASRSAVIAALLLLALAPAGEEAFLNVLHIQFQLALAAALVLAVEPPRGRAGRAGHLAVLFLAPLCGPAAIVFLPLFVARALLDRDRARWAQVGAFAAGAAIQLLLFFGGSPVRGHLVAPGTLAAVLFVRLIALPLLNVGSANRIGIAIYLSQLGGGVGWWAAAAAAALLLGGLFVAAAWRRDGATWLVAAGLAFAAASFGYGMVVNFRTDLFSVDSGERYNLLPQVLLGLGLIALAARWRGWPRRVCGGLVALVLLTGAIRYPAPDPVFARGPSWPAEVAAWRRDHRHPLAVWPAGWAADLSDTATPCPPIGPDPMRSAAPRYCEAGWVAGFYRAGEEVRRRSKLPLVRM